MSDTNTQLPVEVEYNIRHINNYNSELKVINEMVAKGYKLIAVSPYSSGNSLYFERVKPLTAYATKMHRAEQEIEALKQHANKLFEQNKELGIKLIGAQYPRIGWVKGAPKEQTPHYAKVPSKMIDGLIYKAIIIPKGINDRWWAVGDGFSYDIAAEEIIEHLDESVSPAAVSQDAHEKEIMMQAFDKVRQIFEGREWIMDGCGSYPYNDDRYKEEVRYMYNEFDKVVKDAWANIKSKSADYRKAIIAEYLASPVAGREGDVVAFAEWCDKDYVAIYKEGKITHWIVVLDEGAHPDEGKYTTAQLYELFKQQREKALAAWEGEKEVKNG